MRINIAASHRFHLLDLARELAKLGHEVRFYSYVPSSRARKFGLPSECSYSTLWLMWPFILLQKITNRSFLSIKLTNIILDLYLSMFMKPCDIYIALGSVYKTSFKRAKEKHEATTIMEWGSMHIDEQQEILRRANPLHSQPEYFSRRTKAGYEIVDYISLPSSHTMRSFVSRGIAFNKLKVNPYGVDLNMFGPTLLMSKNNFDVICVGAWSIQKGSDIVAEACKIGSFSLLHVGSIVDTDFPKHERMSHVDSVDQSELLKYYSSAKVFVLASRQDGFGMVLSQALACGLPIVCTKKTGGPDLKRMIPDPKWIIELEQLTAAELNSCINRALELAATQTGHRDYAGAATPNLTWEAYGRRYQQLLVSESV